MRDDDKDDPQNEDQQDPKERRTQVEGLEELRVLLGSMLDGNGAERTPREVARTIVEKVADLFAEWGKVKYIERRTNLVNGRGERGDEIVIRVPIGIDYESIRADVLRRWEGRGRSKLGPQGLTQLDDLRTLLFLRDVLAAFGLTQAQISSRLAKLPPTASQDQKRLLASGYYEFFMQLCVHGPDEWVTDEKLLATYKRFHEAHRDAGLATGPALTETAFFIEIGKTTEQVPDEQSPTGQSFKPLRHPKLAQKGEPRKWARRGLGLRSDEEIDALIRDPAAVAQQRFAELDAMLGDLKSTPGRSDN